MKILYIYRHPDMGFSIGRVFRPIEVEMKKYAEVDSVYLPVPNYGAKGLWKNIRAARKAMKAKEYDVVHITGAEHYLIPFVCRKNLIVTVHDLGSILKSGSYFKKLMFVNTLPYARKVSFISEFSQEEANNLVKIDLDKLHVVYNPYDENLVFCEKEFNIVKPRILHIGTTENKNLQRTIEALYGVPCHLRIVGKISDTTIQLLRYRDIEYSNVTDLSDKEIYDEYCQCDIVSFVSIYEGFGMPIIEGNAVGRLVVTSNIEPMKTIAGGAAILVDPYDVASIRDGYHNALTNSQELIKKGQTNIRRFSVDKIANKYLDIYNEMSDNNVKTIDYEK